MRLEKFGGGEGNEKGYFGRKKKRRDRLKDPVVGDAMIFRSVSVEQGIKMWAEFSGFSGKLKTYSNENDKYASICVEKSKYIPLAFR
jgi:hypothetical protein